MGPAFRRFGILLAAFAVFVSGCSLTTQDASAPTSSPPVDPVESTTTTPEVVESAPENEPPPPAADPPDAIVEQQPDGDVSSLANVAGRIVYRTLDGAIAVSSPNGEDVVQLSDSTPLLRSQPTWSNDASRVAWSSFGPSGSAVVVAVSDGSRRTDIPAPSAFYFSWSSDDSRLAALGPNPQGVELFLADEATSAVTSVGLGEPFFFDWVDSDTLTAAISGTVLTQISVENATSTEIELPAPLGAFQAPASLESEQTLAAVLNNINGNDLVIVDSDGAETIARAPGSVTFSPNPTNDTIAVLVTDDAPESQVIAFQADAPNLQPNRVSIIDPVLGESETLGLEDPIAVSWSPDGTTLAVLTVEAAGFEWVFVRDGAILPGDPFIPSQEFFNSYAPFADQYNRSSSWWSPDSQALVFSGNIDGDIGVWVDLVDDGRSAIRVAEGDIAQWSSQ